MFQYQQHLFLFSFYATRNRENDDNVSDSNVRKIFNLSDILSPPPSSEYHNFQQYFSKPFHYDSSSSSSDAIKNSETKQKRYYIYSHTRSDADNDVEEINRGDKSRKARSSMLADRKQISRNISQVLENLLMSYENSQLPTHGQG